MHLQQGFVWKRHVEDPTRPSSTVNAYAHTCAHAWQTYVCAHGSAGLFVLELRILPPLPSNLASPSWTEMVPPLPKGRANGGPGLERPIFACVLDITSKAATATSSSLHHSQSLYLCYRRQPISRAVEDAQLRPFTPWLLLFLWHHMVQREGIKRPVCLNKMFVR